MCCEILIHFVLVKAKLCRFRIGSQHLYPDFFKAGAILCKQFNFRVNQRRDRIDFFPTANIKDRIKINWIVNTWNKVMCICYIQSRSQIRQISSNDSVAAVH